MGVVNSTPLPLWPQYAFSMRLGGQYSQYGFDRAKKKLFPVAGIEPKFLGCAVRSLVAILTALSHFPEYHTSWRICWFRHSVILF
jgi:hypothetical protein